MTATHLSPGRTPAPRIPILLSAVTTALVLSLFTAPQSADAITVAPLQSNRIWIDTAADLRGAYVGFGVTNNDGVTYGDLWVRFDDLAGPVIGPAPGEDGDYRVGALAPGQVKPAYFYLQATMAAPPQPYQILVYDGPPAAQPPIVTVPLDLTVEESIVASANKVRQVVSIASDPVLGSDLVITIEGETGTVGSSGDFAITPAGNLDWPADVFELRTVHTELLDPLGPCAPLVQTIEDALHAALPPASSFCFASTYTFRIRGDVPGITPISPVAYISSGAQIKHTALDCLLSAACDIPSPVNETTVGKAVSPTTLPGAGMATYAIALSNAGAASVTVDDVVDLLPNLPGAATYVPSSATYAGVPLEDPSVAGQELRFTGPFVVPAAQAETLRYDVMLPATPGTYENMVAGVIGNQQIDATSALGDDVPASASVTVGSVVPFATRPAGLLLALVLLGAGAWARRRHAVRA